MIWDIKNGIIVKVADNKVIEGIKGLYLLDEQEIDAIYSKPPTERLFGGWFEACEIPFICFLTQLIDEGKLSKTTE